MVPVELLWRGRDLNLHSSDHEPDEFTITLPRFFPFSFFHYSHLVPGFGCLAGIEPALSKPVGATLLLLKG